jgi:hypothetical protein
MRLQNLKDAGSLLPAWAAPFTLNVVFLCLYVVAQIRYEAKPYGFVASACSMAILLSLVLAIGLVVREIINAKHGEVASAASQAVITGMNISWAITCCAFICYVSWNPVTKYVAENMTLVASSLIALVIAGIGFTIATPAKKDIPRFSDEARNTALALSIAPSIPQQPTFQVTIADLTRLIAHQAGRAIGYAGSNVFFDDSFSLELDANDRIARVYSNSNLIHSSDFMYWRLHMLMIGSASEKVLTGSSSQVALDDLTSFDSLASQYLTLSPDRTFNSTPCNVYEAQIKASRIAMLRKSIFDRCHAACVVNRTVLIELVKLMRTRSVLTYGDIRSQLDRVQMPDGFPVASFGQDDILQKALLTHDNHIEVTLDSTVEEVPISELEDDYVEPTDRSVNANPSVVNAANDEIEEQTTTMMA